MKAWTWQILVAAALLAAGLVLTGCEGGDDGPTGSGILTGKWTGEYSRPGTITIRIGGGDYGLTFALSHEGTVVTGTESRWGADSDDHDWSYPLDGTYDEATRTLDMTVHFFAGTDSPDDRRVLYTLDASNNQLLREDRDVASMPRTLRRE